MAKHISPNAPLADRLTYTVVGDCWEFSRYRSLSGYGRLGFEGKVHLAHRMAYQEWVGPIPDGMHVLHSCDNPPCINPAHLRLGTDEDNAADCVSRGRHASQRSRGGKLSHEDVFAIRTDSRRQVDIAADYGITASHVSRIKSRHMWGWLT